MFVELGKWRWNASCLQKSPYRILNALLGTSPAVVPVYCEPPLGTQVFGGSPPRYLSGNLGQTISSLSGLQGKQGENLFLLITTSESQSQAAHHQGLADTEVEGVVEWLDLDEEAECLLVQDVAHFNFFSISCIRLFTTWKYMYIQDQGREGWRH